MRTIEQSKMKWLTICVALMLSIPAVISDPVNTNEKPDVDQPIPPETPKVPKAAEPPKAAPPKPDEPTTSTATPEVCIADNCDDCLKHDECYFCLATKTCAHYPFKKIIPNYKNCTLGDVRWGVCWMNFKVMIITVSVLGGVLILSIIICCCCCCRKKKRSRLVQDDAKREREKEERRIRGMERQKERQSRNDEIRRKYGLLEGLIKDEHPYQKFDSQNS